MYKQRTIKFRASLALLVVVTGSVGSMAHSPGLATTSPDYEGGSGGSSGGGC